jgi:amino acid permease
MNLAILKTTILSIILMGVVILLAGIALLCWKNQIAPYMRYLLPIPPIGVASYVFVYNMFSHYGGTRPSPFGDIVKEVVWASAISSMAFLAFTLILVFLVSFLKDF